MKTLYTLLSRKTDPKAQTDPKARDNRVSHEFGRKSPLKYFFIDNKINSVSKYSHDWVNANPVEYRKKIL